MAPVAHSGGGLGSCETSPVSTRPRAAVVLLPMLLVGPVLLAGCGERGAADVASSSSTVSEESSKDTATETSAVDASEQGTSDTADFPADIEPDTAQASTDAAVTVSDIRIGGHDGFDRVVFEVGGTGTPGWDVRYVDAASSRAAASRWTSPGTSFSRWP